jgi:hypothetical protein
VHETASTKVNKLTLELERIPQQIIDKWQTKIDQEQWKICLSVGK